MFFDFEGYLSKAYLKLATQMSLSLNPYWKMESKTLYGSVIQLGLKMVLSLSLIQSVR